MIKSKTVHVLAVITATLLTQMFQARGGSITNNFDTSADFMANGVPGSMWDGVYLGFGDVPDGDDAGDVGYTLQANETANPGYLTVQSSQTDWAGSGDDGFFLFKVVAGDFDVSVQNVEPWDNSPYHQGGLLVRAFTASGPLWGSPYGGSENSMFLPRFQEFGIGEDIRYTTNGLDMDGYIQTAGDDTDLATSRYYRITRVGNVFSFYTKTNQTDEWALQGSLTRDDLDGAPMQVGIGDATFGSAKPLTYYTDFELSGTNVNPAVVSPADPTGLTATVAGGDAVTFSWTPGAGSSGSLLVIRKNNPQVLSEKPINGYNYNAETNFMDGDNLGGSTYAVYVGSGNSVTITGLGSIVDTDYAAVYSYSGSGSSIVYGANPATTTTTGSEPIVGVSVNLFPTNIPVNGSAAVQVVVTYGDGSTTINPNGATLDSSDSTVAVTGVGAVSGVGVGTAEISAAYAGFSGTNYVSVNPPAYTNNFSVPHNFLTDGLPGSSWDGLYSKAGDVPNASYVGVPVNTTVFDAGISSNNVLSMTAANSGWQNGQDNGPFLFKNVPGDFQASVHITAYNKVAYNFVGLMARAYSATDNASPNGPGFSENFVEWLRFDQYGISTTTFNTINGANTETDNTDGETTDYWLLMSRVNGTNFYFFKKTNLTDAWVLTQTITRPDFTNGVPLQVGLAEGDYTGNAGTALFDSFSLDATNISGGTPPSTTTNLTTVYNPADSTFTLTWTPGTNADGSMQTSFVIMRQGAPISAQPYFGILTSANPVFGQGTDLGGGNYLVYNAVGNTVTVSGLTAGATYYAAVYGYSGGGTTKSFNQGGSAFSSTQAGNFIGIEASLSGEIPLGGIGMPVIHGLIEGGGMVDVSSSATLTSGDTNMIVTADGILTGLAVGSETNTVTFQSGTNVFTTSLVATVRAPSFADNFSTSHDYFADGVTNTAWDGVYARPAFTIPDTTFASDPAANVFSADANITSNNVLTVTSENVGWENSQNDGFFLFKYVPADFQMAVHITTPLLDADGNVIASYNYPGLLARAFSVDNNGNTGAPFGGANGESFVSWGRFDEFGIGTRAERIINNNTLGAPSADVGSGQLWLLEVRQSSTNFYFFQRANATDPWLRAPAGQSFSVPSFAGAPMQAGIMEGGFDSGNIVTGQFDSFMLDAQAQGPQLTISSSGGNVIVSWPTAAGSYILKSTASLSPADWQPVNVSPVIVGGFNTVTLPATNSELFFRLVQ